MIATATLPTTTDTQALPKSGNGRFECYTRIHKALRHMMAETLIAVGRADAAKEADVAAVLAGVRELTHMCRVHLHTENQFVHPAMEARRPGSSESSAADHADHELAIERVDADARCVEVSSGEARASLLFTLYNRLALFVADNLVHMNEEESFNQAVLWETYTDDELRALEGAIVASHAPEDTALALRWMLPALPPAERDGFVGVLRGAMPDVAFQGLVSLILSRPGAREDARLLAALGRGK